MTITPTAPTPPTFTPPPAPSYVAPPPPRPHKLSGALIAGIVAGVVLIAGGATAAVVLTRSPVHHVAPAPPKGLGGGGLTKPGNTTPTQPAQPAQPAQPSQPAQPTQPTVPATSPAPNQGAGQAQGGAAVPMGYNISITPASGWKVEDRKAGYVEIDSASGDAILFVYVTNDSESDIDGVLQSEIQAWSQQDGISDLQVGQLDQPVKLAGPNFTEEQALRFQGVLSTQQGTTPIEGVFDLRLNPTTGIRAFAVLGAGSQQALQTSAPAAGQMLVSMD